jgi:hypothetical protein
VGPAVSYGLAIQLISTMTQAPPVDQRIVDEYFQLVSQRKTKDVAWLYGMVATYGLKPDELKDFDWGPDNTIHIPTKKRTIRPLHPQWVLLFNLKEKRSCKLQDRWDSISRSLYEAIAFQLVQYNITDLILAHRIRKNYVRSFKQPQPSSPAFAGAF